MRLPVLCLFLFSSAVLMGGRSTHLQYLPGQPVNLNSVLTLDITQSLPGLSLSTKGKQSFLAELTISQEQAGMAISQPPFDLNFHLKGIKIGLQANEQELVFDSSEMGSSLYLSQLSKLIDKPLHLRFKENFQLDRNAFDFKKTLEEFPIFQEINPVNLLDELFSHLFGAAGRQLKVGDVIERDFGERMISSLPTKVTYTITEIDDYHVYAEISGDIEKRKFDLQSLVQLEDKVMGTVSATLSGTLLGKIKWNRDNAMLYHLTLDYSYAARLQLAQWEWLMNVNLNLNNQTQLDRP